VSPGNHPIILYDGHCALCSGVVQAVLRLDDRALFRFAPLQSSFAREALTRLNLDPDMLDSVVVIDELGANLRSAAALRIARLLGWPYRVLGALQVLPQGFLDRLYDWTARNRYRIFGRHKTCWLPQQGWAERFIEEE